MSAPHPTRTMPALPPEPAIPADATLEEIKAFRDELSPRVRGEAWLVVLTSALVSCHHGPETVVHLYELALAEATTTSSTPAELAAASHHIQRSIQEVLVKGSVIFGIPPALDTVFALLDHIRATAPPEHLLSARDFARASTLPQPIESLTKPAHEALRRVYKHNLDQILDTKMSDNMPVLKFLTLEINYGFNLANQTVINWQQTELVVLAALVTQNCRAEVLWHMRGALRAGWEREDVQSVRSVSKHIARRLGVRTERVPDLDEVKEDSND